MTNLPIIPILENEELWSQRAVDEPESVLEEMKITALEMKIDHSSTVIALLKTNQ
jgi:hypothetical protein